MRPETYSGDAITKLLRKRTIATMPELMSALGTTVRRTVFRKLTKLSYRTSYSHGGRYYTLDELAHFDSLGLWAFKSAWFSAHGSLVTTVAALVRASEAGYFISELDDVLHVKTKDCLRGLVAVGTIAREAFLGRYLFCSADAGRRSAQLAARRARGPAATVSHVPAVGDEIKATLVLFLGMLDEKQRRAFAGLESMKFGPGGDALVGKVLGRRSRRAATSCSLATSSGHGCDVPERVGRRWKKNAGDHPADPGTTEAGHRRRSHERAEVDTQDDDQDLFRTRPGRPSRESEYRRPPAHPTQLSSSVKRKEDLNLLAGRS
jgi:hypothetical protein